MLCREGNEDILGNTTVPLGQLIEPRLAHKILEVGWGRSDLLCLDKPKEKNDAK